MSEEHTKHVSKFDTDPSSHKSIKVSKYAACFKNMLSAKLQGSTLHGARVEDLFALKSVPFPQRVLT
jgi:hypothetical protein